MRPIVCFLIGLSLFLLVFAILASNPFGFPHESANWLALACLFLSVLFSFFALIKGIRSIKKKEQGFALNLVTIIGASVIIALVAFWTFSLLLLLYSLK